MASIDRADWHSGGDFPENLPEENGGTHIGMFINWIIDNDLIGELHLDHSKEGIEDVKQRKITGRDFLFEYCDGKFWDECVNKEGLKFTQFYYQDPETSYGEYIYDYEDTIGDGYESMYEIPDTWSNYDSVKLVIDKKYLEWKLIKSKSTIKNVVKKEITSKKPWWKFW